jgi:acyl carrier protein
VVALNALPLTVNGKLDKRALPAPEYQDADRYRAPADALEELLTCIYAQILGVERVGVDESFFDLGGNSLSAMKLVTRVRAELGIEVAVQAVFDEPTVARMAKWMRPYLGAPAMAALTLRQRRRSVDIDQRSVTT